MKKVLLLTDIPPCKNFTAGLVLDQLSRFFEENELACCVILNKDLDAELSPDLDWVPTTYFKRPFEGWGWRLPGWGGAVCSFFGELWNEYVKTRPIVDKVVAVGEKFKPDVVWCVLQGQTMIRVARPVSARLGVPLLTHIWDPPDWWMRAHRVNCWSRKKLLHEYEDVLRESFRCFTASEAMARKYAEDLGANTEFFIPSLDRKFCRPPAGAIHPNGKLVIAMAGQLYSTEEWKSLINSLDLCAWKVEGRSVEISLIGSHEGLFVPNRLSEKIRKLGWLSQDETIRVCSDADILYCPYWFSKEFKQEATLSFPSKLTTYLAAGRPVLLHGPEYASPSNFLKQYDAGFFCNTLNPDEILKCLSEVVANTDRYAQVASNGNRAFLENMTIECMDAKFKRLLSVEAL